MGRVLAVGVAVACALVSAYLATSARDEAAIRTAADAGRAGDYRSAAREASRVPSSAVAARVEAAALFGLGRAGAADAAFARAAALAPADWRLRRDWALARLAAGDRPGAAAQMRAALAHNPRLKLPPGFAERRPRGASKR
jgi:Flp pilus assembly protein TadD